MMTLILILVFCWWLTGVALCLATIVVVIRDWRELTYEDLIVSLVCGGLLGPIVLMYLVVCSAERWADTPIFKRRTPIFQKQQGRSR